MPKKSVCRQLKKIYEMAWNAKIFEKNWPPSGHLESILNGSNAMLLTGIGYNYRVIKFIIGLVLTSRWQPDGHIFTLLIKLKLFLIENVIITHLQFEYCRQKQVYSCFLFSWLYHASAILVHSCQTMYDKSRQEWTWMKEAWCNLESNNHIWVM